MSKYLLVLITMVFAQYCVADAFSNTANKDIQGLDAPTRHQYDHYPDKVLISYFEHPQIEKYKHILVKSYDQLGIAVKFTRIEGERAYVALNDGLVDGDIAAELPVAERYPNVLVVQPALLTASIFLYCQPDVACTRDILSKENLAIFVDNVTMNNFAQSLRDEIKAQIQIRAITTQLLKMLRHGRINYIIIGAEQEGLPYQLSTDLQHVKLFETPIHHVLNKKHAELLPTLKDAISRQMALASEHHH